MHEKFSIYEYLGSGLGLSLNPYSHVLGSLAVLLTISILSFMVWKQWRDPKKSLVPSKGITISHISELFCEMMMNLIDGLIPKDGKRYFPLIGSLFLYILSCNILGLIPGFAPPTDNINTNLSCSLIVFVFYNYEGIRLHGLRGYLREIAGPVLWLAPLIFFVELTSHIVRPISLSMRLYGNMMGDHMVLGIFTDFIPFLVPTLIMLLGLFTSIIQALVFSILSVVYIALARGINLGGSNT